MKRIGPVFVLLFVIGFVGSAAAACGYARVTVAGTPGEIADACRAIGEVRAYFRDLGFDPSPVFAIEFVSSLEAGNVDDGAHRGAASGEPAFGTYDAARLRIRVMSGNPGIGRQRKAWGIAWDRRTAYSILEHELVHAAAIAVLGAGAPRLGRAWHEFVAYAVQFELMDEALRSRLVAAFGDPGSFDRPENVNLFVLAADPEAFAVRAYAYAEAHGGPAFIGRLLRDEAGIETGDLDFLWAQ